MFSEIVPIASSIYTQRSHPETGFLNSF